MRAVIYGADGLTTGVDLPGRGPGGDPQALQPAAQEHDYQEAAFEDVDMLGAPQVQATIHGQAGRSSAETDEGRCSSCPTSTSTIRISAITARPSAARACGDFA